MVEKKKMGLSSGSHSSDDVDSCSNSELSSSSSSSSSSSDVEEKASSQQIQNEDQRHSSSSRSRNTSTSTKKDLKRKKKEKKSSKEKRTKSSKKEKRKKKSEKSEKKKREKKDSKNKKKKKKKDKTDDFAHEGSPREEEVNAVVEYEAALQAIEAILKLDEKANTTTQAASSTVNDILNLLQRLDARESVCVEGLGNQQLKQHLLSLFQYLRLEKSRDDQGQRVYLKAQVVQESFMEKIQLMLLPRHVNEHSTIPTPSKEHANNSTTRKRVLGPTMPTEAEYKDLLVSGDEEDVVGPALPGEKGFRIADEEVAAKMQRMEQEEMAKRWKRARGEEDDANVAGGSKSGVQREEWMTSVPQPKSIRDKLGRLGEKSARTFTNKDIVEIDRSWFSTPEERDRVQREKAEIELLGYSRGSGKEVTGPSLPSLLISSSTSAAAAVHESICPSVNPEADARMKESMEKMRAMRGKSLLEQHQEEIQKRRAASNSGSGGGSGVDSSSAWNRERDLNSRRQVSSNQSNELLKGAASMSSRFSAPQTTRHFL